jgi:hypothetical protein
MPTINLPLKPKAYKYLLSVQGKMKAKKGSSHVTLPQTMEQIILDHEELSPYLESRERLPFPKDEGNNP